MKKLSSLISAILIVLANQLSVAQCLFVDPPPPTPQGNGGENQMMAPYDSKNGWYMPASGEVRILFVFYEVNYTGGTDPTPPLWRAFLTRAFTIRIPNPSQCESNYRLNCINSLPSAAVNLLHRLFLRQ